MDHSTGNPEIYTQTKKKNIKNTMNQFPDEPWPPKSYTPEEKEHSLREGLEVVVSVDVCAVHHGNLSKHLKKIYCPH